MSRIIKIKTIIWNIGMRIWDLYCYIMPISSKKIVCSSYRGKNYGDNPGCILDEIIKQHLDYDLVWLQNNSTIKVPFQVRSVKYGSWKAKYELSTAKIIINNVKNGPLWKKKKGQYYIQTWHGAFPFKLIEQEIEDKLPKKYVELSKEDSKNTDLMISGCKMGTIVMQNSFWYNGEIMECGVPRNDILLRYSKNDLLLLKKKYNIPENYRVLLYAPTFRDNGDMSPYNLDLSRVIKALEKKTEERWLCIIRLHPNISNKSTSYEYSNLIRNGSFYPDAQELLIIADFLITDYSSIMMDFALMGKNVALYVPDFERYKNEGRGLRNIVDELPFPLCKTNDDVVSKILSFSNTDYSKNLNSFITDKYISYDDGHACERIVERIKKVIK